MKLEEIMIAWGYGNDRVKVGPHPDRTGWSSSYGNTDGACWVGWGDTIKRDGRRKVFLELIFKLVILYQMERKAVCIALSKIDGFLDDFPELEKMVEWEGSNE